MANYANLLATIAANIYTNGNNEVTAAMVKTAVDAMVASLGDGYQFMGIAHPGDTPSGYTDLRCFWIASEAGTYTNFGGKVLTNGKIGVISYDSAWSIVSFYPDSPILPMTEDTTYQKSGIWAEDGTIYDNNPYLDAYTYKYNISNVMYIKVRHTTPLYNASWSAIALYRNGKYIKSLLNCNSQVATYETIIMNDVGADTLAVCQHKNYTADLVVSKAIFYDGELGPRVDTLDFKVKDIPSSVVAFTRTNHKIITSTLNPGDAFSSSDNNYRALLEIDTREIKGKVKIENILGVGAGRDIALVTDAGVVKSIFSNSTDYVKVQSAVIDLGENIGTYKVVKIYANVPPTDEPSYDTPIVTNFNDGLVGQVLSLNNDMPLAGAILLHCDAGVDATRVSLMAEYGLRPSWCIGKYAFGDDNTFASDWTSTAVRDLYYDAWKRGEDIALYPALNAGAYDENGWNNWLDTALANLGAKGIYNITTFACGQLAINDDLLNALTAHDFKIIRGGWDNNPAVIPYNTYPYSDGNKFMPLIPSRETQFVAFAEEMKDNNIEYLKGRVNYAIQSKTAVPIFLHQLSASLSEASVRDFFAFLQTKIASGDLVCMTWRDYFSQVNRVAGHEWDYNRLFKMCL